jgi:NADH:ubiquinone oxidoreductase subunit 2 (subunit N)
MTTATTLSPSVIVLLVAAGVCLLLETTGAGVGQRKRVSRLHHGVVVTGAGVVAFSLSPSWALATTALALVLFALTSGVTLLGERAALALLLAAGTAALTSSPSLTSSFSSAAPSTTTLLAFVALWATVTTGLSARAGDDAAAEAATKAAVTGAVATLLCAAGVVAEGLSAPAVGRALVVVGVALVLGAPPLQGPRVDVAHGAPVSAVVLSAPLALWVFGPALGGLLSTTSVGGDGGVWRFALDGVLVLGLFALPLVALAQTSVRRVLAVLVVGQGALPLAASLAGTLAGTSSTPTTFTAAAFTAALGAAGLATSVAALPALLGPAVSWEDAAGQGRLHPWRAGLLVLAAAQACGLPPAAGFVVRARLAEALSPTEPWVAAGLLVGAGLSAVPVVRLALFLFAKQPRRSPPPPPARGAVFGLVVVVALGVVVGLFLPR